MTSTQSSAPLGAGRLGPALVLALLAALAPAPAQGEDPPTGRATSAADAPPAPEEAAPSDATSNEPRSGATPSGSAASTDTGPDTTSTDSSSEGTAPPPTPRDARPGPLDTIVVIGRGFDEAAFDSPFAVDTVDGEDISTRKAFRSFPEALREVPGVLVQRTGPGQGSPFIRGFTGFRTLLLVDGVRLNHTAMRDGPNQYWNTVDPLIIDRIEVVKGPSSVLYGSDAIGGTVNAITRSPGFGLEGFQPAGRLYYRYASAESSHIGRAEAGGAWDGVVGAVAGFSLKDFGNIHAGEGSDELPNTNYDESDGDAKIAFLPRDDLEVVVAWQHVRQTDVPRTHSTIFSKSFHGTTIGSDLRRDLHQQRDLLYAQATWDPTCDWLSSATVNVSYQRHEETESRLRSNGRFRSQGFTDDVFGAFVRLESPSPIGTLSYGIEYYRDQVDSFFKEWNADGSLRSDLGRGPVADGSGQDLLGIYLQDAYEVTDDFEITGGGRLNWSRVWATDVDTDPGAAPDLGPIDEDWTALVGSLRALYRILDEWNVYGGVSQGFRSPNLSDLTRFDVSRSGEVEIPSPGLDPERFLTLEAGTKLRFEGVEATASYYYTFIDDMIVRVPTGMTIDGDPAVTKDNAGDGFLHGVELGLSWNFWEGFTAIGAFAWQEGAVDTYIDDVVKKRQPISRVPPLMGLVGLRWDSEDRDVWVEGTVTFADDQDRLSPRDEGDTQRIPPGGTPGYTIYTIRAGVVLWERVRLFGAVENISNKDYRVHGSGQNEVGTNAIIGFDCTL